MRLTFLLLVAAVLMSTPALIQGGVENPQKAKINLFTARKLFENRQKRCGGHMASCFSHVDCCWPFQCPKAICT
nr:TPA_inf: conotoxin precursor O2 [Conus judaeus]